jgi:hypothetical protein
MRESIRAIPKERQMNEAKGCSLNSINAVFVWDSEFSNAVKIHNATTNDFEPRG